MKTYKIVEINPHEGPHFDEAVAARLARRYGAEMFIGVETAKAVPKALEGTEEENLSNGHMPLGQLRGSLDDKDHVTGERNRDGFCCAMKMAQKIGIDKMPELSKLFRAVNRVDGSATASKTDISSLMKMANKCSTKDWHPEIFAWAEEAVDTIIDYLILEYRAKAEGKSIDCTDYVKPSTVISEMIGNGDITDKTVIALMRDMAKASEAQIGNCIESAFISRAMKATGKSDAVALNWLSTGFSKFAQQQGDFQKALVEIKKNGVDHEIDPRWPGDSMKAVFIKSDNMQIAEASRSPQFKYAVCVVRRSTGNVAIIPNQFNRLNTTGLLALIRMEETPKELRKDADYNVYSELGTIPTVPHWHGMSGGLILNGSNFIKAEPTTLDDAVIMTAVKIGFVHAESRFKVLKGVSEPVHEANHNRRPLRKLSFIRRPRQHVTKAAPIITDTRLTASALAEIANIFDGNA